MNINPEAPRDMMVSAIAMALYRYNVSPDIRAGKLFEHFKGACCEMPELIFLVDHCAWATSMPFPTAIAYQAHALEVYGTEAAERFDLELRFNE